MLLVDKLNKLPQDKETVFINPLCAAVVEDLSHDQVMDINQHCGHPKVKITLSLVKTSLPFHVKSRHSVGS